MARRRGRPKKNLPLRDKGTPELIIKRMQLVQGGDTSLSTTPLDRDWETIFPCLLYL